VHAIVRVSEVKTARWGLGLREGINVAHAWGRDACKAMSGIARNEVYTDSCRNRRKAISAAWREGNRYVSLLVSELK
jgi:hypothetical protein